MPSDSPVPPSNSDRLHAEHLAGLSNEILTHRNQQIVCELLAEAQGDLGSIDTKIAHIRAVLDGLTTRRAVTRQRIGRLRCGIAPHKHLPPEILAKIFVQCLGEEKVPVPRRSTPCMAWDLGQVCTRWRGIAHGEALFWNNLEVNIGSRPGNGASQSAFQFLHDILSSRGGQGKVQIEVYPGTAGYWRTFLGLVSAYSSRLWKLTLVLDDACSQPLALPRIEFDGLESVSLIFKQDACIYAFENSPNIRTANFNFNGYSPSFLGNAPERVFPWTQLTDLTLQNIHPSSVFSVLVHCSLLVKLELGCFDLGDIHPEGGLLSLVHLQSLSIYVHSTSHGLVNNLLSQFVLPSLKEFQVEHYNDQRRWFSLNIPSLVMLIERSGCALNSVRMPHFTLDMGYLIPVMRVLPQITELVIDTADPASENDLSIIQTEGLLPNLQKFNGCTFSSLHSAIEFLRGRCEQTTFGNHCGLRDFVFRVARGDYSAADQEIFESLLPEWEGNGGRVQLIITGR